jgi:flagellar M-ring protein FliF
MGNVLNNLKHVWQQAGMGHRVMLVGIVLGFLAITGVLIFWASQPEFALLYSGLNPEDAAKIVEKLRDEDIPFRLKDGGTTILAPARQVHSLRLIMVREGLPAGGNQGYGILDNGELGQSPFKERVNYIRAIEGELVKTILLIDGVVSARVHIVNEQHTIFTQGQREASATVVIKTRSGSRLLSDNVAAITSLVAGAVKGVTPDKVVVVVNGELLAGRQRDDMEQMAGSLFEYKMKMEKYFAQKAETMLAQVLGPGRATVKVNAQLSTTRIQRTRTTFDPKGQVETRTKSTKRDKTAAVAQKRGNASPGGGDERFKEDTVEFVTPQTVEQEAESPGKIESLAVAVFVDLSAVSTESKEGAQTPAQGAAGSPARQLTTDRIREAVGNALGLARESWKDSITVVDVPFHQAPLADVAEIAAPNLMGSVLKYAKDFSLGIAVLGVLIVLRTLRGKKAGVVVGIEGASVEAGGAPGGTLSQQNQARQLKGNDRQLRSKIVSALNSNPDQVKQLFLSWVESSQGGK